VLGGVLRQGGGGKGTGKKKRGSTVIKSGRIFVREVAWERYRDESTSGRPSGVGTRYGTGPRESSSVMWVVAVSNRE